MNQTYQWISWVMAASLGFNSLVTGCKQLNQVGIGNQPIESVLRNSSSDAQITVRGEVMSQVKILNQGAYLLQDSSGMLWVVTEKTLPAVKSTVTVRGKAQQGITFASINADVVLAEDERL
jgi:hypothetical protein